MLAVFVNCGAVILGSIIGLLFSKKFTEELSGMIQTACGIISLVFGLQMAFKYDMHPQECIPESENRPFENFVLQHQVKRPLP